MNFVFDVARMMQQYKLTLVHSNLRTDPSDLCTYSALSISVSIVIRYLVEHSPSEMMLAMPFGLCHRSVPIEMTLFPNGDNTTAAMDGHNFPVGDILDIREEICVGNDTASSSTITNKPFVECLSVFTSCRRFYVGTAPS